MKNLRLRAFRPGNGPWPWEAILEEWNGSEWMSTSHYGYGDTKSEALHDLRESCRLAHGIEVMA